MSEVFLGINKAGQLYVDATLDASITHIITYPICKLDTIFTVCPELSVDLLS